MTATIRNNALHAFAEAVTGITWIWANQNIPRPNYPYGTLFIPNTVDEGQEDTRWAHDGGAPAGEDMSPNIHQLQEAVIRFEAFTKSADHNSSAMAIAETIRRGLVRPNHRQALSDGGVAPLRVLSGPQDLSAVHNGEWVSRAVLEMAASIVSTDSPANEAGSYIDVAEVTSDIDGVHASVDLNEEQIP